jgi:hypothetical protein
MILNSACLVEAISTLEVPLAEIRLAKGSIRPEVFPYFIELWKAVNVAFVFIEEISANALRANLMASSDHPWKSAMRNKMANESVEQLDRWISSDNPSSAFQRDLRDACTRLGERQVDAIELTGGPQEI